MRAFARLPFLLIAGAIPILGIVPEAARSQVPDSLQVPPVTQEQAAPTPAVEPGGISPRGAFIRSSLLPGWGHAKVGALVRGGFYFSVEATASLMIFKTHTRLSRTQSQLELRESVVTARLEADGITDSTDIESALAKDPEVEDLRALEKTRIGQREDWIALGLFFMLIGGVDAYVSAHLADFPTAVVLDPTPAGGVEIGLSLPIGF